MKLIFKLFLFVSTAFNLFCGGSPYGNTGWNAASSRVSVGKSLDIFSTNIPPATKALAIVTLNNTLEKIQNRKLNPKFAMSLSEKRLR